MKKQFNSLFASLLLLLFALSSAVSQNEARMLRFPDINNNLIAFVYAGDIWTVPAEGGNAKRLTSHKGLELFPKISPDGKWIAFSAEYSGNRQVYVIPAEGGKSKQLTYYNSVGMMPPRGGFDYVVLDWTADSKNVLIRANRHHMGERMGRYYLVNIDGGLEKPLPIVEGGFAALSPDDSKICFTPVDREFRTWKRYKGGRASDLWIYDLKNDVSEPITNFAGTDQIPVWYNDKIYFASDRDLTLNIYCYNTQSKKTEQITTHTNFDAMWPSGANGMLVYENGGYIFKLNLETNEYKKVLVNIHFDNPNLQPYYKNASDDIHSAAISPTAQRVLFDARGDIFSVPAEEGVTKNLTKTQGVREVYPNWSPDGKYIAYYSDASGEYEVYLLENKKDAQPVQITSGSKGWRYGSKWSPDSKYLLFSDRTLKLQLLNIENKKTTIITSASDNEIRDYSFSPDSKWVTYSKEADNGNSAVWVYNIEKDKNQKITNDVYNDSNPVFSTDGNYIFFRSNRDFNLEFSSYEFSYLYNNATRIYACALRNDSPKLHKRQNDTEPVNSAADTNTKTDAGNDNSANITIDVDNIQRRIVALPLSAGSYYQLIAIDGGLLFSSKGNIKLYKIKEEKAENVLSGASLVDISADGKKILYKSGKNYGIVSAAPNQNKKGNLSLKNMEMKIEPQKEWEQIFDDAWRIFRDYFYVENLHNVDWNEMKSKYKPLVEHVGHRIDLDYILSELVAESNAGHAYVNYGDYDKVKRMDNGLLGAELAEGKNGYYKFEKIFEGENWNKNTRSPLTEIGVDVNEGDYLIEINGEKVKTNENPYKYLENKADKLVEIGVSSKASGNDVRTYLIKPIKSEISLRYIEWVNERRKMVDKLSDGKIGYIHVPNTSFEGNRELFKGMYAYHNKEALIIDDRYNGGGFIPDIMTGLLERETLSYWARRGLNPMKTPAIAHDGPKVMLINGYSSSGGDAFPYYFRKKELGKLIGTRTWGGLVGISGNASLVDGGYIAVPRFGIFDEEGNWIIEGIGVYPDIEVIDKPHLLAKGKDPCIEKAVEVLLQELKNKPTKEVKQPADPNRKEWIEEDID